MTLISRYTLAVGSGKGGVGKSTVAVNLAVSLAKQGLNVGLLDADIYGPSIPLMFGLRQLSPQTTQDKEGNEIVLPFSKFGVQVMSIGFFLEENRSAVWRGPVLHGALQKMIQGVFWQELDLLLIDLPPGTGDVPLSLSQLLKIDSALIVTTPQECAALDALKAIHAFDLLKIPIAGIVENMAGFTAPETGTLYSIFGRGKADALAKQVGCDIIGRIPILPSICQGSDEGYPPAFHQGNNQAGSAFQELACSLCERLQASVDKAKHP